MTKSNSSATLSTSNLYEHPWYVQLKLLDSTTTCESQSQPKPKLETPGQTCTKRCAYCQKEKNVEEFSRNRNKGDRLDHRCKKCIREATALINQLKKHAPPKPDACQICGSTERRIVLDHCHSTNTFRGWICSRCNQGLGSLGDTLESLQKAVNYLSTSVHGN
jgi:hypothetical protein